MQEESETRIWLTNEAWLIQLGQTLPRETEPRVLLSSEIHIHTPRPRPQNSVLHCWLHFLEAQAPGSRCIIWEESS